jgi:RHO1 GDP-GTP exchange protein 1/2
MKPIPLELLILAQSEDSSARGPLAKRPSSGLLPPAKTTTIGLNLPGRSNDPANKGYALTFTHLGRRGYNITLFAPTWVSRRKWVEHIEQQQRLIRERSSIFTKVVVCEKYFMGSNKVNCAVAFGWYLFKTLY